jgi:alkylhydroperoxidase family enzyme
MSKQRIAPLEPPFSEPVSTALARIMPEGVAPLVLFRTLAVNERVFLRTMAAGLLDKGSITLREREIVILRTCARLGSEYEWGVHVTFFGKRAAFTDEEVIATQGRCGDGGPFSTRERTLLEAVDELVDQRTWSDTTYAALSSEWSPEQLVEIVALVGFYHLIAFTTNAFRIPPEPFGARFTARG